MAVQDHGRIPEDARRPLLLPAAAADGHLLLLLRRRQPPPPPPWRRRRRRAEAVVQLEPAPAEPALRRGHRRLRRVLQQVGGAGGLQRRRRRPVAAAVLIGRTPRLEWHTCRPSRRRQSLLDYELIAIACLVNYNHICRSIMRSLDWLIGGSIACMCTKSYKQITSIVHYYISSLLMIQNKHASWCTCTLAYIRGSSIYYTRI